MGSILKKMGVLLGFCIRLNIIAFAQNVIGADQVPKYIGKTVDMTEIVSRVSYNPVSRICMLTIPDSRVRENSPEITIIIHNVQGSKQIHWLKTLTGRWIEIHGKILFVKNKFIINGDDPHTRWNRFYGMIEVPELPPVPQQPDSTNDK